MKYDLKTYDKRYLLEGRVQTVQSRKDENDEEVLEIMVRWNKEDLRHFYITRTQLKAEHKAGNISSQNELALAINLSDV